MSISYRCIKTLILSILTMKISIFQTLLYICLFISCSEDSSETTVVTDENGEEQTVNVSLNRKSVGDSANDLLSGQNFDQLEFEIFYVTGFKPTDNTISNFEGFLGERLNKTGGVAIELKEIDPTGKTIYSIEDVRAIEDDIRTNFNDGNKIAVFGIFLDGSFSENTENGSVLGVAYRNTSFVIFEETVQSFSGQALAPSTTVLETTVLDHEFGHLMGMVNAGTPLQSDHQDVEHGRHCTTDGCLMSFTAETGEGLLNSLSGGAIPVFDSLCLEDLRANGGK